MKPTLLSTGPWIGSAGHVFLSLGLGVWELDVVALLLGDMSLFHPFDLGPLADELGNHGRAVAVRSLEPNHVLLFLQSEVPEPSAEPESQSRRLARLDLVLIDLSGRSVACWESAIDIVRMTELGNGSYLLEYAGGHYARAKCDPVAAAIRIESIAADITVDCDTKILWTVGLSTDGPAELSINSLELPIKEANPFRIHVRDDFIETITLCGDRISAERDERTVGVWFPSGKYSVLDFNAERGRILICGENGRLQVIEPSIEASQNQRVTEPPHGHMLARTVRYLRLGRPDLARDAIGKWFEFPLNFYAVSRALVMLAEIQCDAGLFEQSQQTLELLSNKLSQASEIPESHRMFIQNEVGAIAWRIQLLDLQEGEQVSELFDVMVAEVQHFEALVPVILAGVEGCIVADEAHLALTERVLKEIGGRVQQLVEESSHSCKALRFLNTLLARSTREKQLKA